MESPEYSPMPHHMDTASRPSLGFPLGTALLLIVIFSLSGIFSCCYHWDKFRSLRQAFIDEADLEAANHDLAKPPPNPLKKKEEQKQSLPVIMPGNKMPTFIAMPCPCEPLHPETLSPPPPTEKPPKPPRFPVPLY